MHKTVVYLSRNLEFSPAESFLTSCWGEIVLKAEMKSMNSILRYV